MVLRWQFEGAVAKGEEMVRFWICFENRANSFAD